MWKGTVEWRYCTVVLRIIRPPVLNSPLLWRTSGSPEVLAQAHKVVLDVCALDEPRREVIQIPAPHSYVASL